MDFNNVSRNLLDFRLTVGNPLLSVGMDLLTGKIGLQKIYYSIPIYRKWTTRQLARAERRLGIKSVTLLPLKLESMPIESDMKLETINV